MFGTIANDRAKLTWQNTDFSKNTDELKWWICNVVIGDELLFNHRKKCHKQSNGSWFTEGEKTRNVVF